LVWHSMTKSERKDQLDDCLLHHIQGQSIFIAHNDGKLEVSVKTERSMRSGVVGVVQPGEDAILRKIPVAEVLDGWVHRHTSLRAIKKSRTMKAKPDVEMKNVLHVMARDLDQWKIDTEVVRVSMSREVNTLEQLVCSTGIGRSRPMKVCAWRRVTIRWRRC
jgi:hypothetical protein